MSSPPLVLLVSEESATATAVAEALQQNGRFAADSVCRDLDHLVDSLTSAPVPAVLVDIDPAPSRMLADLEPIISRFTDTRFIVLSGGQQTEFMLEAMQVGARHFLCKPSIAADLVEILQRLVPKEPEKAGGLGVVITMLSASGGCGATTLAVNLANELQALSSEPSMVVDLDTCYGAVANYLGLEGNYGLAQVLADRRRIDPQLIVSTALAYSDGLKVLISPASINLVEPAPLEYGNLREALKACKHAYKYTVVDAARVPLDVAADLAQVSQVVFIIFQLTIKDIRVVRSIRSALIERGLSANLIVPLANRYRKRYSMITPHEAETALGGVSVELVSNDFKSAIAGLNYGRPLAESAPRSSVRQDIRQLATKIFKGELQ